MKFQVQRIEFYGYDVREAEKVSDHLTPLKALCKMEDCAMKELRKMIADTGKVSVVRTSDERYPDAWGYANNGILLEHEDHWGVQFQVVEV